MIAQTPNLRFVKPLSKYMELRIRVFGRQRFAKTHNLTGSNISQVTLPFVPDNPETLEIYLSGIRVLDGYSVQGNRVNFATPVVGNLEFVDDDVLADPTLKWLVITTPNLLQSNDTQNTAYGTDRRSGPQVATHARPICITQPAIGFCRPSADGEQLLYCPFYGIYGRDSVTYAIKTDMGQYSDFRCIDIRVRDPNYIPTLRLACVSSTSSPVQIDGEVHDIEPNGQQQIYGAISTGQQIKLPNPTDAEPKEYHFILQGKDENGEWFEPEEYFEPDSYQVGAETAPGFTVTYVGPATEFGIDNALLISVMCGRDGHTLPITLTYLDTVLFSGEITSNPPINLNTLQPEISNQVIVLDKGHDDLPEWTYNENWVTSNGIDLRTTWQNPVFETRNVGATMQFTLSIPLYDPATGQNVAPIDYSKTVEGQFTTAPDEEQNIVVQPDNGADTLISGIYWESADPFSDLWTGDYQLNYTFNWQIVSAGP